MLRSIAVLSLADDLKNNACHFHLGINSLNFQIALVFRKVTNTFFINLCLLKV